MQIDYSRCRVTYPDGMILNARFILQGSRAAIWIENRVGRTREAKRVLYTTEAVFEKASNARLPNVVTLPNGTKWEIMQTHGGCNCNSPLKGYTTEQLLDPDFTSATR